MLRNSGLIIPFLLFVSILQAQEEAVSLCKVALWQGFEQEWTYNHRLNRLGNYVEQNNYAKEVEASLYHAGASGTGADVGTFQSYYSIISTPNVRFYNGTISIPVSGREKEEISIAQTVQIPIDILPSEYTQAIAVINGYDLCSETAADKLESFKLSIDNGHFSTSADSYDFEVNVALKMNCQSLECPWFKNTVDYSLTVSYLVILSEDIGVETVFLENELEWERKDEARTHIVDYQLNKTNDAMNYEAATVAFTSLSINLDKAHWFKDWGLFVDDIEYIKGNLSFDLHTNFVQSDPQMRKNSAYPKHSRFSMFREGNAHFECDLAIIHFKNAEVQTFQNRDAFIWRGKNQAASCGETQIQHHLDLVNDEKIDSSLSDQELEKKMEELRRQLRK